jgi:hypothetical protein
MRTWSPLAYSALLVLAACGNSAAAPAPNVASLLDGRAALQPEPLAGLAYDRAVLGARWLAGVVRPDGSFYYEYDPVRDRYDEKEYNEVRHAGTTYAMWTLYGAVRSAEGGGDDLRKGAEAASRWIARNSPAIRPHGRAFAYQGRVKLGGQALAIVALLERRRVTGDTSYDPVIADLARFMLAMELPRDSGRYHQSYDIEKRRMQLTPRSNFYPGEALLALVRLAQQDFKGGPWLQRARAAAEYLIHRKDGDIIAAGKVPREDHWLTMALAELYRLDRRETYRQVVYLQGDAMLASQLGEEVAHPAKIGAADRSPISYTSTATKGEALAAAWSLARAADDEPQARRFAQGARRNAQFRMRVQWLAENTGLFPEPERVIGAWGGNPGNPTARIDFVQHNISALIGLWYLTRNGDLPIAGTARRQTAEAPAGRRPPIGS